MLQTLPQVDIQYMRHIGRKVNITPPTNKSVSMYVLQVINYIVAVASEEYFKGGKVNFPDFSPCDFMLFPGRHFCFCRQKKTVISSGSKSDKQARKKVLSERSSFFFHAFSFHFYVSFFSFTKVLNFFIFLFYLFSS